MNTKPISPFVHGLIDYAFSAALFIVPELMGLKKKARRLYAADAVSTVLYSAATSYPLGIKHIIPYKTHRAVDCLNIALLASLTLYKPVQKDKLAFAFSLGMAAAALLTVLLTDWETELD